MGICRFKGTGHRAQGKKMRAVSVEMKAKSINRKEHKALRTKVAKKKESRNKIL